MELEMRVCGNMRQHAMTMMRGYSQITLRNQRIRPRRSGDAPGMSAFRGEVVKL